MIGNTVLRFFLIIPAFMLVFSCAKVSSPSGGPRDKEPPVIVKSTPVNGAKNFKGKNLSITFNEYVVLDKINEKFMVSPPMRKKPRVFIRGKSVNVEFEENLKDSTTYTFYFQDAIRDLNEGNIINNYQFVFSTGPVIDSLSVTGNVYNAYNLEIPENTLILLHKDLADSAVVKQLPEYISRVDNNGGFRIDNVHEGKYRLYALKDIDNSKSFNLAEEEFAFLDSLADITPGKNYMPVAKDTAKLKPEKDKLSKPQLIEGEYKLILFAAQKKARYLTSSDRKLPYQMIYSLSLPPDSMRFDFSIPGTTDKAYFIERSKNKDTIKIWLTDSTVYSQTQISTIVNYPFTDTSGLQGYKKDTILMRFLSTRPSRAKVTRTPFKFSTGITSGFIKPGRQIVLRAQTPFRQPDTSRLRLYEILNKDRIKIPFSLTKDSTNSCNLFMTAGLMQGKSYLFIADSAAFGNIYGEYSDSTGIKFSVRMTDSYGLLRVNVKNYEGDRIIQLLDNNEKPVSEVYMKKDGKIEFPLLEKGFYRLRSVYDINGDGKWTTGDFAAGRQPEPVSYYPSEIEIKVNWRMEQDWDLGLMNFKDQKLREKSNLKRQ